ncbi:hypothetical protein GS582_10300 [Rhodococcus hoagii]|nr:hypothetical protein [Prescottella equi]
MTVDLFRPARAEQLHVVTRSVRDGNRIRVADAEVIQQGEAVARASVVFLRRSEQPPGELWTRPDTPQTAAAEPPRTVAGTVTSVDRQRRPSRRLVTVTARSRGFEPQAHVAVPDPGGRRGGTVTVRPRRDGRRDHQPHDQLGHRRHRVHQRRPDPRAVPAAGGTGDRHRGRQSPQRRRHLRR